MRPLLKLSACFPLLIKTQSPCSANADDKNRIRRCSRISAWHEGMICCLRNDYLRLFGTLYWVRCLCLCLAVFGCPANAASSGVIQAQMTIPYRCAVTVPPPAELVVKGAQASTSDTWTFVQNDRTVYAMTPVTVLNKPDKASIIGSITLAFDGSALVQSFDFRASQSKGDSVIVAGNLANNENGKVTYRIIEKGNPRFYAGDYQMITTLTCSQSLYEDVIADESHSAKGKRRGQR